MVAEAPKNMPHMSDITDVDEWLQSNGMTRRWAEKVASQVKKEYPYLGNLVKECPSNRPELEIIQLVHHVLKGRFPVTRQG